MPGAIDYNGKPSAGVGGGGVSSVFGRSGNVAAQSGDYDFSYLSGIATTAQGGLGQNNSAVGFGAGGALFGQLIQSSGGYVELALQNTSPSAGASTDLTLTADNGTATTQYLNLGINSSGFTGTGPLNIALGGYLYASDGDLSLGCVGNKTVHLLANNADVFTLAATGVTSLVGLTLSGAPLIINGNINAASWTTNGIRIKGVPGTLTDTTGSGTIATAYTDVLGGNTIAATNSVTVTNYVTQWVKDPVAGTNVTLTSKWALGGDSLRVGTSNQLTVSNAGVLTAISPVVKTGLVIYNPANTFAYTLTPAAIAANRVLNLPLITGTDTLACLGLAQTFVGNQSITGQAILSDVLAFSGNTSSTPTRGVGSLATSDLSIYVSGSRNFAFSASALYFLAGSPQIILNSDSAPAILFGAASDATINRSATGVLRIGTNASNALGSLLLTNLTASGTLAVTGATTLTGVLTANGGIKFPTSSAGLASGSWWDNAGTLTKVP
jgi:hypothetical protein